MKKVKQLPKKMLVDAIGNVTFLERDRTGMMWEAALVVYNAFAIREKPSWTWEEMAHDAVSAGINLVKEFEKQMSEEIEG